MCNDQCGIFVMNRFQSTFVMLSLLKTNLIRQEVHYVKMKGTKTINGRRFWLIFFFFFFWANFGWYLFYSFLCVRDCTVCLFWVNVFGFMKLWAKLLTMCQSSYQRKLKGPSYNIQRFWFDWLFCDWFTS